ncbi:hypothetical protein GP486_000041 [Trichoglossum hirsutum]|uniref:Major facilitator superfamily (MFS) profile domain-containing protein n=1 Tax=Trichoglossum hirsutum TaxID=265104 RepID=A0A9P8RTY1_9PEZI|nr:hypothetical protein GP486_000041 [Trichoglossum hirsutum]
MTSHAVDALVELDGNALEITGPPPVLPKSYPSLPDTVELDQLNWSPQASRPDSVARAAITPSGLEMSRPPSPTGREVVDVVQSFSKEYKIGYAIVSLIFISNAVGFLSAAPFTEALQDRFGRAKALMIAETLIFFLVGLGMAINLALNNVFISNLANSTSMLGLFHGSYGVGGTIGPLIATAIASHSSVSRWSRYYFLSFGVTAVNLFFAGWAFWHYERDAAPPVPPSRVDQRTATAAGSREQPPTKTQLLAQALRSRTTLLGALFIFAYQGAEVSISGWIISFLISYRAGKPSEVGYVTAGFWAGITIGRFVLTHAAHRVGEKLFVALMVVGAIVFELLVWLVPNVIGDAVAVSLVGLLLGPIYPCAMHVFSRLLPRQIQVTSLSFISATGSSGGAIAPFTTGAMAQVLGTYVLHPVCIGLFVAMEGSWFLLPKVRKRKE